MEITGNKYLHKKFKKQSCCNPIYNIEDKNDNVLVPVVNNGQCGEIDAQKSQEHRGPTDKKPVNFLLFKDNNHVESVPNFKSTNYDDSLVTDLHDRSSELANVTLDNQSSISKVAVSVNVAKTCSSVTKEPVECYNNKYRISDEANIVRQNEPSNSMNLAKTSNVTSCISTLTTSLLANELKENIIRNFSFDTKVSVSEPSTSKTDKSSIFDTVYSKYSSISERPNAVGIKSDVDEMANKSSGIIYNKSDTAECGQQAEVIATEKKPNCTEPSGGKYVCTYCNLACSKPSVLQKHIRAHTNERPYPCVSCGFSFKTRSNLYKHCRSRTHANRVMGNKHVQAGAGQMETMDIDSSSDRLDCADEYTDDKPSNEKLPQLCETNVDYSKSNANHLLTSPDQSKVWEQKSKPYKPRFHTAKIFLEENKLKENDSKLDNATTSAHFRATPNPIIIEHIKNKHESQESQNIKSNPDILKLRINELIHKNNSIMNCDDAVVIRRRNVDTIIENVNNNEYISQQVVHWQQPAEYKNTVDEPLNLTAKNRKRCLSDSDNTQKSLIKELLLKNLSTDPNLQCPYCKMIFQTVTELEMHKLKYCNAKTSNIRYARSSSVNVASILTQNKNAFDNIPHMQHTTFPLKSPGPCLGKTRLIENERQAEKYRTFSFDDNVILHHTQSDSPSFNKYMLQSAVGTYPLSPQIKKNPIRLFGGEVKITQTSGETRSFKIESESINKMQEEPQNFMEFSANLSENLVIKSGLHSGGTVLQNKANYSPKTDSIPSPNIIRMYDNSDLVSPSLNLQILNDKPKFTFDKISQTNLCQNDKLLTIANNDQFAKRGFLCRDAPETNYSDKGLRLSDIKLDSEKETELYKSNLIDFGQKACKLLAPNLKPPNLKIPGLPVPSASSEKIYNSPMAPLEINTSVSEKESPIDKQYLENLNFAKKQISLQQRMAEVSQPQHVYNPMNLFVNGKVIPYVPGIPGPVIDVAADQIYNPIAIGARSKHIKEIPKSPRPEVIREAKEKINFPVVMPVLNGSNPFEKKTPTIIVDSVENRPKCETKSLLNRTVFNFDKPVDAVSRITETKTTPSTATVSSSEKVANKEESRRFVRPTSLALKPTSGAFKSHHGLTPTMFNQALISPDTPRVAKKYCQQYLNGNYFSYLGLKSSTKSVYCTLNKTQPFYVKHFKKLSMYSEWRQQESKIDSLSVSAYDYRQRQQKYTMAGYAKADLIAHSSYKFVKIESPSTKEDNLNKSNSVFGGYESNEDYTYIRGRGRGRYVCEQCGIRCKKPSMLKKHIRTHSDDRPYTCEHCNFSFKTKGNLTKHMKSKAHSKKYAATSSTSTQNSNSTSSDTDESDGESSDESTRLQEHEAAHCLLSLAHKNNQHINIIQDTNSSISSTFPSSSTTVSTFNLSELPNFLKDDTFLKNPDQISQVTNTNFAKNKILDETSANFNASKHLSEVFDTTPNSTSDTNNVSQYLGKSDKIRPLTYPYLQTHFDVESSSAKTTESGDYIPKEKYQNKTASFTLVPDLQRPVIKHTEYNKFGAIGRDSVNFEAIFSTKRGEEVKNPQMGVKVNDSLHSLEGTLPTNIVYRKRKLSSSSSQYKVQRNENVDSNSIAVDLRVPIQSSPVLDLSPAATSGETFNGLIQHRVEHTDHKTVQSHRNFLLNHENQVSYVSPSLEVVSSSSDQQHLYSKHMHDRIAEPIIVFSTQKPRHSSFSESNSSETFSQNSDTNDRIIGKIIDLPENSLSSSDKTNDMYKSNQHADRSRSKTPDYMADQEQSAMQTLAEIAIKQVKLEKNILAKNVASEYLKLALNCDGNNADGGLKHFVGGNKETVNELMVKPEENKNCSICLKNFSKPSQLRLHMNIHYLERPFRCETCSVSFRTKGHLQKHERSASHNNKLSTSPASSSSEPRPFKCSDCNSAFRIHGHLAKHLRSKLHIMKLECLAKIPFGLYAELERANSLLTEINTTDGDLCLESLKILAKKLFSNDPNKLDQLVNQTELKMVTFQDS